MKFIKEKINEMRYRSWLGAPRRVDHLRSHHVLNLYKNYLAEGEIPSTRFVGLLGHRVPICYPLLIDHEDDTICKRCSAGHPIYSYEKLACNREVARELDTDADLLLGLIPGKRYSKTDLERIFEQKANSQKGIHNL